MCDGDGGGDGGGGDVGEGGYGGTTGAGGGYGESGVSGGNVGGGAGPTSDAPVVAPTGRGDLPGSDVGAALAGGGSGGGGGWEEATTLVSGEDPALSNVSDSEGAFGFTPNQGLTGGLLAGGMFPGLSIPFGLGGYLMGHATGGNVDAYGGGDPDFGGGPLSEEEYAAQRAAEESRRGSGGGDDGDYLYGIGGFPSGFMSGSTSSSGGVDGGVRGTEPLRFSGDSGLNQYKARRLTEEDEMLGEEFTEFTKNLF